MRLILALLLAGCAGEVLDRECPALLDGAYDQVITVDPNDCGLVGPVSGATQIRSGVEVGCQMLDRWPDPRSCSSWVLFRCGSVRIWGDRVIYTSNYHVLEGQVELPDGCVVPVRSTYRRR